MHETNAEGLIHLSGIDSDTLRLVMEEFREGELQNRIAAEKERRLIARANAQPVYWNDDFRVVQRVSRRVHNQWILREGSQVWSDGFHQRYFRKHFPECFPKQISPKIQVGYAPGTGTEAEAGLRTGSGKRETINYGEI